MTDYGRHLSHEVLSTWGTEQEALPGHGFLGAKAEEKEPSNRWFAIGGDLRAAQTHTESKAAKSGRFIWMQAMLDFGVHYESWTAVFSVGQFDRQGKGDWDADSQRFYLMKQINDENMVRAGRYMPSFGINIPEHISPTRGGPNGNGLGFGFGQERDGVEWHYIGENWNAALGYAKGPQDGLSTVEHSVYGQVQRAFLEKYKLGASLWSGRLAAGRRQIMAVHGLLGFTQRLYALTETDIQLVQPDSGAEKTGIYGYHKLGYEFYKGLHVFGTFDHLQPNLKAPKQYIHHWGVGVQLFPRPHFEIAGAWTRELAKSVSDTEGDYAWLLLHYYL